MPATSTLNILLSSCGRRVALGGCFRESLAALRLKGSVYGIDSSLTAPAVHLFERGWQVPRCTDPSFVGAVLALAKREGIRLIVPTIDTELPVYARSRALFGAQAVTVCVSDPTAVEICADKEQTHAFLVSHGFPAVRQATVPAVLREPDLWRFPLIVKPRRGSASAGVQRVTSVPQLSVLEDAADLIVQEVAPGQEYTVNVYVDREGRCRCAVPHQRLEVRAGEVSKGITRKHRGMMELARAVAEALPGAFGPLNIQCFMDDCGSVRIIEMNARFGGGYPLAHRAGAKFTEWLIDELEGNTLQYFDGWTADLAMLRYDEAVFVSTSSIRS